MAQQHIYIYIYIYGTNVLINFSWTDTIGVPLDLLFEEYSPVQHYEHFIDKDAFKRKRLATILNTMPNQFVL